jgi:hypothetical protein
MRSAIDQSGGGEKMLKRALAVMQGTRVYVLAALSAMMLVVVADAGATTDTSLTNSLNSVTTYFTNNIGAVIAAFVGIAVFLWLLRMAFRSFGIRKPRSVD